MWLVDCDEDKGNPSTTDRSHQLALTHLRQHTTPSMSLLQHPIIKAATFGEWSRPMISLTTGWLLGNITRFSNEEYTPSSGWGHYLTTLKVIFLFVSACRNAEENVSRLPKKPSMGSARRERTRRLHTITGGMTSSWTFTLTIGCGPIWSVGLNGFVWLTGRRSMICHCCLYCAWESSTGRLPTIVFTKLRKQSGMVLPLRFVSFPE